MKKFLALSTTALATWDTWVGCAATAPTADPAPGINVFAHLHGFSIGPVTAKVLLETQPRLYDTAKETAVKVSGVFCHTECDETAGPEFCYTYRLAGVGASWPNRAGRFNSTHSGKTSQEPTGCGQLFASRCGTTWENSTEPLSPGIPAGCAANSIVPATSQDGILRPTDTGHSRQPSRKSALVQFSTFAMSMAKNSNPASGAAPNCRVLVSTYAGLNDAETEQLNDRTKAVTACDGGGSRREIRSVTTSGAQGSTNGRVPTHVRPPPNPISFGNLFATTVTPSAPWLGGVFGLRLTHGRRPSLSSALAMGANISATLAGHAVARRPLPGLGLGMRFFRVATGLNSVPATFPSSAVESGHSTSSAAVYLTSSEPLQPPSCAGRHNPHPM